MLHFSPFKIALIALVCLLSLLFALPNFFAKETVEKWPSFVPKKQMALGLDLKGGAHLLLAMDDRQAAARTGSTTCAGRCAGSCATPRSSSAPPGVVANNAVQVRLNNAADMERGADGSCASSTRRSAAPCSAPAATRSTSGRGHADHADADRAGLQRPHHQCDQRRARDGAPAHRRLGTTEPLIVRQGRDRILVQVPGLRGHRHAEGADRRDGQAELPRGARHRSPAQRPRPGAFLPATQIYPTDPDAATGKRGELSAARDAGRAGR